MLSVQGAKSEPLGEFKETFRMRQPILSSRSDTEKMVTFIAGRWDGVSMRRPAKRFNLILEKAFLIATESSCIRRMKSC